MRLLVSLLLLLATPIEAAPCWPASLPAELRLLDCPARVTEHRRGCLKTSERPCAAPTRRNFVLEYQGVPAQIGAAWKTKLEGAGWKVVVVVYPSSEPPRAYDVVQMLQATRGNARLTTSVLIGPGTGRTNLVASLEG